MGVLSTQARIEKQCLFVAPLIFSFLCFIQLPSNEVLSWSDILSPLYFLLGYLLGAFVTCGVLILLFWQLRFVALKIPALLCVLPLIGGFGLTFSYGETAFGIPLQFPVGAAFIGVGSVLLLALWAQVFCTLERRSLVPTTAAAFALAYLLKLLFTQFVAEPYNLIIIGAAVILSSLPLDRLNERGLTREGISSDRGTPSFGSMVFRMWKPFLGCALYCMIWGATWGNSLQGASPFGMDFLGIIWSDGVKCITAVFLCAWSLRCVFDLSEGFLLPLAVGLLLLAWIVSLVETEVSVGVSIIASGIGCVLFSVALWVKISEVAHNQPGISGALFLGTRMVFLAVIFIFIVVAPYLGTKETELATPIGAVLFFVLLATVPKAKKQAPVRQEKTEKCEPETIEEESLKFEGQVLSFRDKFELSPREAEIFSLFVRGYSTKFISEKLVVSQHTVKTHVKRIYEKLDVHSKDTLIAFFDSFVQGTVSSSAEKQVSVSREETHSQL